MISQLLHKIPVAFTLSIAGYFCAYLFELGYIHYFGVQMQTARVTLTSYVLVASFSIFAAIYLRNLLYPTFMSLWSARAKPGMSGHYSQSALMALFVGYLMLCFVLFYDMPVARLYIPVLIPVGVFVFEMLTPLLHFGKGKTFNQMVEEELESSRRRLKEDHANSYTFALSTLVATFMIVGMTCLAGGALYARSQRDFKTFQSEKITYVVLREYDNMIVGKQLKDEKITGKLIYKTISDEPIVFDTVRLDHTLASTFFDE